jgi:hypothetical protein
LRFLFGPGVIFDDLVGPLAVLLIMLGICILIYPVLLILSRVDLLQSWRAATEHPTSSADEAPAGRLGHGARSAPRRPGDFLDTQADPRTDPVS